MKQMSQTMSAKRAGIRRLAIVLAVLCLLPVVAADDDPSFLVVVHADNPTRSMERKVLSKIFLKKIVKWEDWEVEGQGKLRAVPIDLSSDSPTREAFSRVIHGRSISAVINYWQRNIFSDRAYPPEAVATVEEVFAHILQNPGGIGYVPADAVLPDWVQALEVTGD